MKEEQNSGADATEQKDEVVFITIYKKDRDWINKTKGKLNREDRLHDVIESYRNPSDPRDYPKE